MEDQLKKKWGSGFEGEGNLKKPVPHKKNLSSPLKLTVYLISGDLGLKQLKYS